MPEIYGIDPDGEVTPIMVRDAIIKCFTRAHKHILDQMKDIRDMDAEELAEMEKLDVELLIRSIFDKTGGDYNNPTKEDLMHVIEELAAYARNFRRPDIINKHKCEINALIEKL